MDVAALLLLVAGAALYMYAHHRAGQIAAGRMQFDSLSGAQGGWNIDAVARLETLSRIGLGTAIAGLVVGIVSTARPFFKRSPASIDEQADDPRPS